MKLQQLKIIKRKEENLKMQNNEETKYYTRSNGEKIEITTTSLAKRLREVFDSQDKDIFYNNLKDIKDIQEEIYRRINEFGTKFESDDVNEQ